MKKFKWQDTNNAAITVFATNFGNVKEYIINTLYNPVGTVVATMPALQEMCRLYLFAKVYAAKVSVTFQAPSQVQNPGSDMPGCMCYIAAVPYGQSIPNGSTLTGWGQLRDYVVGNPRYCGYRTLGSTYNAPNMVRLHKYYKIGNLVGNPLEYRASSDWDQPIGSSSPSANPTKTQTVQVGVVLQNNTPITQNFDVVISTSITYYVKFWGFKYQVG